MKRILSILLVLLAYQGFAQKIKQIFPARDATGARVQGAYVVTGPNGRQHYTRLENRCENDSVVLEYFDVATNMLIHTEYIDNACGTAIDTTSLSNRINRNLQSIIDTAATLRAYTKSHIDSDLDTDPTNEYNMGFVLNATGDSLVITDAGSRYAVAYDTSTIDTASLSNRINSKLSISDTAAMLASYITSQVDTTSLSNRINLNTQTISDSASVLRDFITNHIINDLDTDVTNELGSLDTSANGDTLIYTNGAGGVDRIPFKSGDASTCPFQGIQDVTPITFRFANTSQAASDTVGYKIRFIDANCQLDSYSISEWSPWRTQEYLLKTNEVTLPEGIATGQNVSILAGDYDWANMPSDNGGLYILAEGDSSDTKAIDVDNEHIDSLTTDHGRYDLMDLTSDGFLRLYQFDDGGLTLPFNYVNGAGIWRDTDFEGKVAKSTPILQGSTVTTNLWYNNARLSTDPDFDAIRIYLGSESYLGIISDFHVKATFNVYNRSGIFDKDAEIVVKLGTNEGRSLNNTTYASADREYYKVYSDIGTSVDESDDFRQGYLNVTPISYDADSGRYYFDVEVLETSNNALQFVLSLEIVDVIHQKGYEMYEQYCEGIDLQTILTNHGKTVSEIYEQETRAIPEYATHAAANAAHALFSRVKYYIIGDPTLYIRR